MEPFCKLLIRAVLQLYCTGLLHHQDGLKVACCISSFTLQGQFLHIPAHYSYIYTCIGLLISIHYIYFLSATVANLIELISFPSSELRPKDATLEEKAQ